MFNKFILDFPANLFDQLSNSIEFENIADGRKGANLINCMNNLIPLVRTTTVYHKPHQNFLPIHFHIIDHINKVAENNLEFNNALVELYDYKYRNMKYHSDQSIDLNENSYICLFSCYDDPITNNLRKLKIKNKISNECFDIILDHNSVVIFSTNTNRKHLHKIVLEQNTSNNLWLGITFRQSKTFIFFNNELPYFSNNKLLTLADEDQRRNFFKCRSLENSNIEYVYPEINYTISFADVMFVHM